MFFVKFRIQYGYSYVKFLQSNTATVQNLDQVWRLLECAYKRSQNPYSTKDKTFLLMLQSLPGFEVTFEKMVPEIFQSEKVKIKYKY